MIIDGSHGEGGGQILRTAIALSCITGEEIEIINIRANRPNPGLASQHLAGLKAAVQLADAKTEGLQVGSTSVKFLPQKLRGGYYKIDIGTAGSVTLVLQTVALPALKAEKEVTLEITGGTDVPWSPSIAYFKHTFCNIIKKIGANISIEVLKHGFYPKGGGKVRFLVKPLKMHLPLNMAKRGDFEKIDVWSVASDALRNARVAERQLEGVRKFFGMNLGETNAVYTPALSPGSSIHVRACYSESFLGASFLGQKGKPAEMVGEEASMLLRKQMDSGACLDEWMADQIIPFLALCGGKVSVSEMTEHTRTNIWVCERFGARFGVDGNVIASLVPLVPRSHMTR